MPYDPQISAQKRKDIALFLKTQPIQMIGEYCKASYASLNSYNSEFVQVNIHTDRKIEMRLSDYTFLPENEQGQSPFSADRFKTLRALHLLGNQNNDQELIQASLDKLIAGLATIPDFSKLMIMNAKVPDSIVQLQLTSLYIQGTEYESCPEFLSQMTGLTNLSIVAFWPLSDSLTALQNLQTIHIFDEQIPSLYQIIDRMPNLTTINVYGDQTIQYSREAFLALRQDAAGVVQPVVINGNANQSGNADEDQSAKCESSHNVATPKM